MESSTDIIRRYRKQMVIPGIGMLGQKKLIGSSMLVIGAGGLGCPALLYLAAAGVGRIGIVDNDSVDLSNLQRQILYTESDQGAVKTERAAEKLRAMNSTITVDAFPVRMDDTNAAGLIAPYDVVLDCSDNFLTRYTISDECARQKKILIEASIHRFEGRVLGLCGDGAPCYRCLYPEAPEEGVIFRCDEAGVIGVLPGIIGSIQAAEAIKYVLGRGVSLLGKMLVFDALTMQTHQFAVEKRPTCMCAGRN